MKKCKKLKLDVGCGNYPSGDVNCDLHIVDTGHRTGKTNIHAPPLNPHQIQNFVLCDAQFLPFKDEIFDEVYSSHVIEHVSKPWIMLKEMFRVSNYKVVIYCPHRFGDRLQRKNIFHVNFLNKSWFFGAIRSLKNCYGKVTYSKYLHIPNDLLSLVRLPLEMRVEIRKNSKLRKSKSRDELTPIVGVAIPPIQLSGNNSR